MKTLDRLLTNPRDTVATYVPIDRQSTVPPDYQNIGDYFLNDNGIHHFGADENGELVVDTIYPIPFIATQQGYNVHLHFFTPSGEVETLVLLDSQTTQAFNSLDREDKAKIDRFISTCLLKGL
jgi:protocatechuate 3,4-dioxygenase beta subunit